jgi:hypothetical protein
MEQPENYVKNDNKVCKLVKSLYGLKQAPRQWNKKFDSFLKLFDLQQSSIDKCVYYSGDKSLILAIYVDDGLAAGRDKKLLDKLIDHLRANFELKSMNCESYLGLEIKRDLKAKTLDISQARYVEKILNKFGMKDSNAVNTPEEVGASFEGSPLLPTDNQFKELLGSLLYLTTCSRPDISHAVSIASRTAQPTQAHWMALKRILRYLKGTTDLGIRFRWENPNELIGYSDADYANDAATRKSTTGYCIYYGGGPIAWRCQRQPIITLSTTEAEYVAGCELVKEIMPIREQLIELGQLDAAHPTTVYIDNQSTVRIATNESGQRRTKHIDIREKWLTEQVAKKKIDVKHISGDDQAADILTKPLYKSKFFANRSKLLTQIITVMMIFALCFSGLEARVLKPTDPLTTVGSSYAFVNGDTRYRLTNVFMNPCEHLFSFATSISASETLVRSCFKYYEEKHLAPLTNCKRLPTIGEDLQTVATTYDCTDRMKGDPVTGAQAGKCEITRRAPKPSNLPQIELDATLESWNRHKKKVQSIPSLTRSKRSALLWGLGVTLFSVFTGSDIKTYKALEAVQSDIKTLANITDLHSQILKESNDFFDQYRESVEALQVWTQDIEDRLGSDSGDSRFETVPRGKKAKLVKTYMQWFNSQEKLLVDINQAAAQRKIPASLKKMLNSTQELDRQANWSTLIECSYRLENKSMVLDLDFILPVIDDNVEILSVVPMNHYTFTNVTDVSEAINIPVESVDIEACWEEYYGPHYVLHNKTNGCYLKLDEAAVFKNAVRAQMCLESKNELHFPANRSEYWRQLECMKDATRIENRIQIHEIDGVHKIYCYPYEIEIEGEKQPCPRSPFILEAHATYTVGNIIHHGALVDTSVSRQVAATPETVRAARRKRSPVAPSLPSSLPTVKPAETPLPTTTMPIVVMPTVVTPTPQRGSKNNISITLKNITSRMDTTLASIRKTISLLPNSIQLSNLTMNGLMKTPVNVIYDGFEWLIDITKFIVPNIGLLTACMMFIILMPVIELVIVGLKIATVPANLWLGSLRRVSSRVSMLSTGANKLTNPFKKKRKRWDEPNKIV